MNDISNAAAIMGRKGGKAGTGQSKARTHEQCVAAAYKMWESRRMSLGQRLDRDIKKDDPEKCWLWSGSCDTEGYGIVSINGINRCTHRVAWEYFNKAAIPSGKHVLHKCDNPPCCNPNHLFLGTHRENMMDARLKNRFPKRGGELASNAKFTNDQVKQIRQEYLEGCSRLSIANKYGVTQRAIHYITSGVTYKNC